MQSINAIAKTILDQLNKEDRDYWADRKTGGEILLLCYEAKVDAYTKSLKALGFDIKRDNYGVWIFA